MFWNNAFTILILEKLPLYCLWSCLMASKVYWVNLTWNTQSQNIREIKTNTASFYDDKGKNEGSIWTFSAHARRALKRSSVSPLIFRKGFLPIIKLMTYVDCWSVRVFAGLRIRIANLFFKLLTCFLYILRVVMDNDPIYATWSVFITVIVLLSWPLGSLHTVTHSIVQTSHQNQGTLV